MRRRRLAGNVLVETDGTTVWINGAHGMLARFGRFGIDIHSAAIGDGVHCLDCRTGSGGGRVTADDWQAFVAGVLLHHGISVPDKFSPPFEKE